MTYGSGRGRTAVVAVGGNSLIIDNDHQAIPDQARAAAETVRHIMELIDSGWNVVLTHGNGPQVGFILRRSELALGEVPPVSMEYAGADTQGAIGFMFQQAFINEFRRRGSERKAVTLVTQVVVEQQDPAFRKPSKPVGSFMDKETAEQIANTQGWVVGEDSGRGWRRMVPSPKPQKIIESSAITHLMNSEFVVIACGGGGIPVVEEPDGVYKGVEAVIDKDLTSSLLAQDIKADLFLITTGVEKVAINYGTPKEKWLEHMTLAEARQYSEQGHFGEGSMAPKVRAMMAYVEATDGRAIITNPENIGRAVNGEAGTHIVQK